MSHSHLNEKKRAARKKPKRMSQKWSEHADRAMCCLHLIIRKNNLWQMIYYCVRQQRTKSFLWISRLRGAGLNNPFTSRCSCFIYYIWRESRSKKSLWTFYEYIGVARKQIWCIKAPRIRFHWRDRNIDFDEYAMRTRWRGRNHATDRTILYNALNKYNFDWFDVAAQHDLNEFIATNELGHMFRCLCFFFLPRQNAYFAYDCRISFNQDVSIVSLCLGRQRVRQFRTMPYTRVPHPKPKKKPKAWEKPKWFNLQHFR